MKLVVLQQIISSNHRSVDPSPGTVLRETDMGQLLI